MNVAFSFFSYQNNITNISKAKRIFPPRITFTRQHKHHFLRSRLQKLGCGQNKNFYSRFFVRRDNYSTGYLAMVARKIRKEQQTANSFRDRIGFPGEKQIKTLPSHLGSFLRLLPSSRGFGQPGQRKGLSTQPLIRTLITLQ